MYVKIIIITKVLFAPGRAHMCTYGSRVDIMHLMWVSIPKRLDTLYSTFASTCSFSTITGAASPNVCTPNTWGIFFPHRQSMPNYPVQAWQQYHEWYSSNPWERRIIYYPVSLEDELIYQTLQGIVALDLDTRSIGAE